MVVHWATHLMRKYSALHLLLIAFCAISLSLILASKYRGQPDYTKFSVTTLPTIMVAPDGEVTTRKPLSTFELRIKAVNERVAAMAKKFDDSRPLHLARRPEKPNYNVHIFYYAFYRNFSGAQKPRDQWFYKYTCKKRQVGSETAYYPQIGCNRSGELNILDLHFRQIRNSGVGVVLLWITSSTENLDMFLEYADKYELKVAFHLKISKNTPPKEVFSNYLKPYEHYFNHTAYYKIDRNGAELPVFYLFKPFLHPFEEWKEYLSNKSNTTIRNTTMDGVYIGLFGKKDDLDFVRKSKFDGFYTFYASNGHTFFSSWKNWERLAKFADNYNLIFSPTVAPGYIHHKEHLRKLTRDRAKGHYYDVSWRAAINNNVKFISINSFNYWRIGTQIEPAVEKIGNKFHYKGYEPLGPSYYLNLTNWWVQHFTELQETTTKPSA